MIAIRVFYSMDSLRSLVFSSSFIVPCVSRGHSEKNGVDADKSIGENKTKKKKAYPRVVT